MADLTLGCHSLPYDTSNSTSFTARALRAQAAHELQLHNHFLIAKQERAPSCKIPSISERNVFLFLLSSIPFPLQKPLGLPGGIFNSRTSIVPRLHKQPAELKAVPGKLRNNSIQLSINL